MANQPQRNDPIREKYYKPLEIADSAGDWLFIVAAVISIIALFVEKEGHPDGYKIVQGLFAIVVIVLFVIGQVSRLYFAPRAEDRRREDLLSNCYGVDLTFDRTTGYYNNNESDPTRRIGLCVLENTFYTKSITLRMARSERIRGAIYLLVWLGIVLYRDTDLGLATAAAQAVFSEQVVSRWLRVEWLRIRSENIFRDLHRAFLSKPNQDVLKAQVLEAFSTYEATKSNGGVVLSKGIFEKLNPTLSHEWDQIRAAITA